MPSIKVKTEQGFVLAGNVVPVAVTVVLPANRWDSNRTQTVTVSGVLADETKQMILPAPTVNSQTAYLELGIRCVGQAENTLTFTAAEVPDTDVNVYVVIMDVMSM